MRVIHLLLFLCTSSCLFAQRPQVPQIHFQSVPDALKLPADVYLGETAGVAVNSKGHIFVFSRGNSIGPAYGAAAHNCWSSTPTASSCERLATICTPGPTPTPSRSTKETISG